MRSLLSVSTVLTLVLAAVPAHAQSTQVGVQYSGFVLEYPDQTRSGLGGFFVYSPAGWFGVDASVSGFFSEPIGGSLWQVQVGPRAGVRWNDVALYARARPGVVRFSERFFAPEIVCILILPPPESCLAARTNASLDLGGTLDVGLTRSTLLRIDAGDTMIRYGRQELDAIWKHNFQFSAGMGWRFR